jgi:hypothetical protein
VSCPSSSLCVVVGSVGSGTAATSADHGAFLEVSGGQPGPVHSVPGSKLQLLGVSCPSDSHCWAVGTNPTTHDAEVVSLAPAG